MHQFSGGEAGHDADDYVPNEIHSM